MNKCKRTCSEVHPIISKSPVLKNAMALLKASSALTEESCSCRKRDSWIRIVVMFRKCSEANAARRWKCSKNRLNNVISDRRHWKEALLRARESRDGVRNAVSDHFCTARRYQWILRTRDRLSLLVLLNATLHRLNTAEITCSTGRASSAWTYATQVP